MYEVSVLWSGPEAIVKALQTCLRRDKNAAPSAQKIQNSASLLPSMARAVQVQTRLDKRRNEFVLPGQDASGQIAVFAAAMNVLTLCGSFLPGADSTPLETSTAYGFTRRTASATFSGERPPARITIRLNLAASHARSQLK